MTTGIILIIIGICFGITGTVFIINAKSAQHINQENSSVQEVTVTNEVENPVHTEPEKEIPQEPNNTDGQEKEVKPVITEIKEENKGLLIHKENVTENNLAAFDSLITLAVADGVLTPNEVKTLKENAVRLGLNYADYSAKIDELILGKKDEKETNLIDKDKEKGDEFEKYVVQKFDKKYFSISEWAGDKYVKGNYAKTTLQPDLKIRFKLKETIKDFSVECKYRSNYYKNGIEWCKEYQLKNYKKFATETGIPVFIVIGIGGTSYSPEELFIVPLDKIESNFLTKVYLNRFKKVTFKEKGFYFDAGNNILQ
jgi:hypothetical protein